MERNGLSAPIQDGGFSISRRRTLALGTFLLSGSVVGTLAATGNLATGHTPNPRLVSLNAARLASDTTAEHDSLLHEMLAIPARNPADLALKLEWLMGGDHEEAEPNCPFIATYVSVARDLSIPIGEVSTCEMQNLRRIEGRTVTDEPEQAEAPSEDLAKLREELHASPRKLNQAQIWQLGDVVRDMQNPDPNAHAAAVLATAAERIHAIIGGAL